MHQNLDDTVFMCVVLGMDPGPGACSASTLPTTELLCLLSNIF